MAFFPNNDIFFLFFHKTDQGTYHAQSLCNYNSTQIPSIPSTAGSSNTIPPLKIRVLVKDKNADSGPLHSAVKKGGCININSA